MNNYKFLFIYFFSIITVNLKSQNFEDSLKYSFKQKANFFLRFETRNSFITNEFAKIAGIKAGLEYNNNVLIGIGYNKIIFNDFNKKLYDTMDVKIGFYHISPFFEYIFYKYKKWEISIPIQLGFGETYYINKIKDKFNRTFIISYEPAMTAQFYLFKYISIGGGIGYRLLIKIKNIMPEKFSSPVYMIKIRILWNKLIHSAKNVVHKLS